MIYGSYEKVHTVLIDRLRDKLKLVIGKIKKRVEINSSGSKRHPINWGESKSGFPEFSGFLQDSMSESSPIFFYLFHTSNVCAG